MIVILGASGDLTARKLIPALYRNFQKKRLPEVLLFSASHDGRIQTTISVGK